MASGLAVLRIELELAQRTIQALKMLPDTEEDSMPASCQRRFWHLIPLLPFPFSFLLLVVVQLLQPYCLRSRLPKSSSQPSHERF